jgi:hypothetical protein
MGRGLVKDWFISWGLVNRGAQSDHSLNQPHTNPPPPPPPPGPLPPLPPSLNLVDVSSNLKLEGDISALDLGGMREVRLGNNSFSGGVPASATTAQ